MGKKVGTGGRYQLILPCRPTRDSTNPRHVLTCCCHPWSKREDEGSLPAHTHWLRCMLDSTTLRLLRYFAPVTGQALPELVQSLTGTAQGCHHAAVSRTLSAGSCLFQRNIPISHRWPITSARRQKGSHRTSSALSTQQLKLQAAAGPPIICTGSFDTIGCSSSPKGTWSAPAAGKVATATTNCNCSSGSSSRMSLRNALHGLWKIHVRMFEAQDLLSGQHSLVRQYSTCILPSSAAAADSMTISSLHQHP